MAMAMTTAMAMAMAMARQDSTKQDGRLGCVRGGWVRAKMESVQD